jgi:hypothetical protein
MSLEAGRQKRRRQPSRIENLLSLDATTSKPLPKKLKDDGPADSNDNFEEKDSANDSVTSPSKPKTRSTNQQKGPVKHATTPKIAVSIRMAKHVNGLKKTDVFTGGMRFVDRVAPSQVIRKVCFCTYII